jgi:hydrogenase/urease accessory protein HupE
MSEFWIWFSTGLEHILDINGYDHILFVSLLALTYNVDKVGKLLLLITAFTIGHSLSLAISTVYNIKLNTPFVEFLIALSILATAVYHLVQYKKNENQNAPLLYLITCFFGLIHGLGFSFLLKSMLSTEQSVLLPLLYFNLGLELGQLIIVLFVIIFSLLLTFLFKRPFKIYKLIIVCSIGLIALKISIERFLELL